MPRTLLPPVAPPSYTSGTALFWRHYETRARREEGGEMRREGGREKGGRDSGIKENCLLFGFFVLILLSVGVRVTRFGSCFVLFSELSASVSRSGQATAF